MKDIIEKIRAAEKKADEIRLQAEKEAEYMLSQEKMNGRKLIDKAAAAAVGCRKRRQRDEFYP